MRIKLVKELAAQENDEESKYRYFDLTREDIEDLFLPIKDIGYDYYIYDPSWLDEGENISSMYPTSNRSSPILTVQVNLPRLYDTSYHSKVDRTKVFERLVNNLEKFCDRLEIRSNRQSANLLHPKGTLFRLDRFDFSKGYLLAKDMSDRSMSGNKMVDFSHSGLLFDMLGEVQQLTDMELLKLNRVVPSWIGNKQMDIEETSNGKIIVYFSLEDLISLFKSNTYLQFLYDPESIWTHVDYYVYIHVKEEYDCFDKKDKQDKLIKILKKYQMLDKFISYLGSGNEKDIFKVKDAKLIFTALKEVMPGLAEEIQDSYRDLAEKSYVEDLMNEIQRRFDEIVENELDSKIIGKVKLEGQVYYKFFFKKEFLYNIEHYGDNHVSQLITGFSDVNFEFGMREIYPSVPVKEFEQELNKILDNYLDD